MIYDSVIIGAGQAGLGGSYFLKQKGIEHTVFEQGRIGESWLNMRWDSFRLNTPNLFNVLPDLPYEGTEPDGFWRVSELVNYFRNYVREFHLPVKTNTRVLSVERSENSNDFVIKIKNRQQSEEVVKSRSLVVASGLLQKPKFPPVRSKISRAVLSLHSADYKNPEELPSGAVVVVGSGQTGCQIAEDLLSAGRKVYLCTSKVGRVPRRYRGRDIMEWWTEMKFWDVTFDSLEDKSVVKIIQPQISGLGRYGHTVSLQYLAGKGAVILGRLTDIKENTIILNDDGPANVQFADEFSNKIKKDVDGYLQREGIELPPPEDDPADEPDPKAQCVSSMREINLQEENIAAIIWATGFTGNFDWLNLPVFDEEGNPIHNRGISTEEGIYFVGFPWLNSRKSGIIYGIEEDAAYVADAVAARLT